MSKTIRKPRLLFLTGTRADYGKLKPLIRAARSDGFEVDLVVTGMHMLSKYGFTFEAVRADALASIHSFMNQTHNDSMDVVLAKTVAGLSDYVKELAPDMVVVHGDRVEALAGAIVGSLNNIRVAHVEGGEVSGTIDELIRHAVSKLSHLHFVANAQARHRLLQLGETPESIFVIGSPDLDAMVSDRLPPLSSVMDHYEIPFDEYGILIFHPVTTEVDDMPRQAKAVVDALVVSGLSYVVIYPNNDLGTDAILNVLQELEGRPNFRLIPSMRFEYFLTLLKNARVVVGNSSAGIREAPFYGVPSVNVGARQNRRALAESVSHAPAAADVIARAIEAVCSQRYPPSKSFGDGRSAERFMNVLRNPDIWLSSRQKYFVDLTDIPQVGM